MSALEALSPGSPDQLNQTESPAPVVEPWLESVNKCLAAAAYSLKFDIAELWRFGPDRNTRTTGMVGEATAKRTAKPYCEHVYAQPATLKTYTGRILGIWGSKFEDSHAQQNHILSPSVSLVTMTDTTRAASASSSGVPAVLR